MSRRCPACVCSGSGRAERGSIRPEMQPFMERYGTHGSGDRIREAGDGEGKPQSHTDAHGCSPRRAPFDSAQGRRRRREGHETRNANVEIRDAGLTTVQADVGGENVQIIGLTPFICICFICICICFICICSRGGAPRDPSVNFESNQLSYDGILR